MKKKKARRLPVLEEERCTGHCCEKFYLPEGPEYYQRAYQRWLKGSAEPVRMSRNTPDHEPRALQDIHLIAPMLVYLGRFEKNLFRTVNPESAVRDGHFYTCKHYDKKSRNCTIYEIRPAMCREYPYGQKCEYAKCTWSSQKAEKQPKTPVELDEELWTKAECT